MVTVLSLGPCPVTNHWKERMAIVYTLNGHYFAFQVFFNYLLHVPLASHTFQPPPYYIEIVKISNFDPHRQAGLDTQAWRKKIILLVFLSV